MTKEEESLEDKMEIDELAGGEGWETQQLIQIWEKREKNIGRILEGVLLLTTLAPKC